MSNLDLEEKIDFGPLPAEVDHLLQQGVAAHFSRQEEAERLFLAAISLAPEALVAYRCLAKHYNRCRQFDKARQAAQDWLAAAARQAALPDNWLLWQNAPAYALAALKGLAFIHLRSGQPDQAEAMIRRVQAMDPMDAVGASVVAALLEETRLAI